MLDQRSGEDRREDIPLERARLPIGAVVTIVTIIVGLLVTYYSSMNPIDARVFVLESQQRTTDERYRSLENRLERMNEKLDRLLERGQ